MDGSKLLGVSIGMLFLVWLRVENCIYVGSDDLSAIDDSAKIRAAIDQTGLGYLLDKLPNGLDSQLGREFDGEELFGGEWQKVAIARCLMSNGRIVVLDEPTASLDPMTESEVFGGFVELARGKTTTLISRRGGPARMTDRIVALDEGSIAEVGTHERRMSNRGLYYRRFNLQARWYVARKPS